MEPNKDLGAMTRSEFEWWERAYLAAVQTGAMRGDRAAIADQAVLDWRQRRQCVADLATYRQPAEPQSER
jgi:hypothetical protein